MNIHENTALLDAFVDGELTSEEMISVQSHLDECPECRAYVDDALAIRASFPTEDDAELSADFAETVMKAVAETPQSRPKKRQPWGKLAAAAATLPQGCFFGRGCGVFATAAITFFAKSAGSSASSSVGNAARRVIASAT